MTIRKQENFVLTAKRYQPPAELHIYFLNLLGMKLITPHYDKTQVSLAALYWIQSF